MSKNLTKRVLWAQGLFLILFAVYIFLMRRGGLLTAYVSLMGFAACGSAAAVLAFCDENAMLGMTNLAMIILSFFIYAFVG
jgi:small-conductance mechanosensitive channel